MRQTRFEERQEEVSGSSYDITGESGTEARTNSIAIEVNAMITRGEEIEKRTHRVPLVDQKTPEIALNIKINGKSIKAISDTGYPVTVIRCYFSDHKRTSETVTTGQIVNRSRG